MPVTLRKYLLWPLLMYWLLCIPCHTQSLDQPGVTFRETVWLQTPTQIYLPGESVLFHACLLEKDTYKPSVLSKNIRIELIDSAGNKLFKQNIRLSDSQVTSSLVLSGELKSGWYYLRAYTNWMRNFPKSEFSILSIKVVNLSDQNSYPESPSVIDALKTVSPEKELKIIDSNDTLSVEIMTESPDIPTSIRLLVHRSYSWYWFDNKSSTGNSLTFKVPKIRIPEGIVQFSVLSDKGTVLASRLWSDYNANRHLLSVKVLPDTPGIRSKSQVAYEIPGLWTNGLNALIALDEPGNLDNEYLPGLPGWRADDRIPLNPREFQKWLSGNRYPNECVQAFFKAGSMIPASPDSLNLPALNHPGISFFPETRAGTLSGRVTDKKNGHGVPSVGVGVTILNDNSFDAVRTNLDGMFSFAFPGQRNSREYILTFISDPDSSWTIEVFPDYDKRTFKPGPKVFTLSKEEIFYVKNLDINRQLSQIYNQTISRDDNRRDTLISKKPFYDPPDWTILTDDYIELANVLEVVYEVVPDVQVRKNGDRSQVSVYNKNSYARDFETLVLLDGIPITNHKELLDLPPDRIKAIEVKSKVYIHGNYIFSSVVNFISRNGDFAGLKLPLQSFLGSFDLPLEAESAYPDKHEPVRASIPDLDPTLLWETGKVPLNNKIDFSANDLYGDFRIMIYGFDHNGLWYSGQKTFKVGPTKFQ